jgi:hypothetical protein
MEAGITDQVWTIEELLLGGSERCITLAIYLGRQSQFEEFSLFSQRRRGR